MIDLHCHILPDVDDGSGSVSDSLEMAALAAQSGVRGIVTTPHCNIPDLYTNDWDRGFEEKLLNLQSEINRHHIPITLYPGQEIYLADRFLEKMRARQLISINYSRYPLVEFGMEERSSSAYEKLSRLRRAGFTPILAHPERYEFVMHHEDAPQRIKDMGVLLQVNRGSVFGFFGRRQQQAACYMLFNRMADFVASDAHSPYSRTPELNDVQEWISENISFDYAQHLLNDNPCRVLKNEEIYSY